MLVDRLMTLKQVAAQAWVEDVVEGDETSMGEVVVETYRGMEVDALHGGWVEVRAREKDNPHG